jgi:hypothetical protein
MIVNFMSIIESHTTQPSQASTSIQFNPVKLIHHRATTLVYSSSTATNLALAGGLSNTCA